MVDGHSGPGTHWVVDTTGFERIRPCMITTPSLAPCNKCNSATLDKRPEIFEENEKNVGFLMSRNFWVEFLCAGFPRVCKLMMQARFKWNLGLFKVRKFTYLKIARSFCLQQDSSRFPSTHTAYTTDTMIQVQCFGQPSLMTAHIWLFRWWQCWRSAILIIVDEKNLDYSRLPIHKSKPYIPCLISKLIAECGIGRRGIHCRITCALFQNYRFQTTAWFSVYCEWPYPMLWLYASYPMQWLYASYPMLWLYAFYPMQWLYAWAWLHDINFNWLHWKSPSTAAAPSPRCWEELPPELSWK